MATASSKSASSKRASSKSASSKHASSKQSAPKQAPRKQASNNQQGSESAQYDVRGLILDLGEAMPAASRKRILAQLRAEVPALAALTAATSTVQPLGKDAGDVYVAFPAGKRVSIAKAWDAVHALQQHPLVADCEPAVSYRLPPAPAPAPTPAPRAARSGGGDDVHLPGSMPRDWSSRAVRADRAQARFGVTGAGVRVGHPDTGYTSHPQIAGPRLRVADGFDFVDDDPDPRDSMSGMHPGHGTATASVIFSAGAPDLFGIAPGAEVVPLRVSNSVIHFSFGNVVQALYRARDRGCHVVSMSLGGPWAGRSLSRAADRLVADGMILLAAAGNHTKMVIFPALLENVIAVAASNADTKPWRGSASGAAVDITAPGESVWRAYAFKKNGVVQFDVQRSSGTSYATATTAGVCALWLQRHGADALRARYGGRLASVFMELLKAHCRPVPGWNTQRYGPGLVEAEALLAAPLPAFGPAPVRAARMAPTRTSAAADWARLQPYLPELSPKQLAAAATKIYGAGARRDANAAPRTGARAGARRSAAAPAAAPPPTLIDEIAFHVATDPAVRTAVLAAGGVAAPKQPANTAVARGAPRAAARRAAPADPNAALRGKASAALRKALGGG